MSAASPLEAYPNTNTETPLKSHFIVSRTPIVLCSSLHAKFVIGLARKCLVLERRWRLAPVVTMSQVHITGCVVAGFWWGTRAAAASIKVFGANFVLLNHNLWMVAKPAPQSKPDEAEPVVGGVCGMVGSLESPRV